MRPSYVMRLSFLLVVVQAGPSLAEEELTPVPSIGEIAPPDSLVLPTNARFFGVLAPATLLVERAPDAPGEPMRYAPLMARRPVQVRVVRRDEAVPPSEVRELTPAERIGMMWQLALDAWAFKGEPVVEQRLPRDVVRVERRRR